MIGDGGFAALRLAATLTHSVPGLRARLRHGGRALVDVVPAGIGAHPAAATIGPCGFRSAVIEAWQHERDGRPMGFWDLPVGEVPAIDLGVPTGGEALPGGIYAVPITDREMWVFATTLGPAACRDEVEGVVRDLETPDGMWGLGIRGDSGTEVSLVYAELDGLRGRAARPLVRDLLEQLLATVAVRELLDAHASSWITEGRGRP